MNFRKLTQKNLSYSKFETGPETSLPYPKISRELFRNIVNDCFEQFDQGRLIL